MADLWIPITLFAALMQAVRTALQKHMTASLSTAAVSLARYLYGLPFALAYLALLAVWSSDGGPRLTPAFLVDGAVAGAAQVIASALMVALFRYRNFAVGITYSKTEAIQTAVLSSLLLGESLDAVASFSVAIGAVGIMVISTTGQQYGVGALAKALTARPALMGLASGLGFAVASVYIRSAAHALDGGDDIIRAAATLAYVVSLQTIMLAAYMAVRERAALAALIRAWRPAGLVGLTSVLGSAGWFTAMTLQHAALVKTLGQIEIVATLAISHYIFREPPTKRELFGMALVFAAVITLFRR
ncbi:EamA family transporter [Oceanibacterium hippocampi]|uniref:EamA-like transporter family protein n=1 Tax=Oceanibacterium hippocampi TaxID=745714 RepID=A0A1Y5TY53_9PROT|nr:EamA family transporter [Oceanibacterium hippocampi]SLN73687.1 EamA-like transporter family protein [Oceanibacterium hippocampi]